MVEKHQNIENDKAKLNEVSDDHSIDLAVLVGERLNTDITKGLSTDEHNARLKQNGANRMTPPKTMPEWLKYITGSLVAINILLPVCFALSMLASKGVEVYRKQIEKLNAWLLANDTNYSAELVELYTDNFK